MKSSYTKALSLIALTTLLVSCRGVKPKVDINMPKPNDGVVKTEFDDIKMPKPNGSAVLFTGAPIPKPPITIKKVYRVVKVGEKIVKITVDCQEGKLLSAKDQNTLTRIVLSNNTAKQIVEKVCSNPQEQAETSSHKSRSRAEYLAQLKSSCQKQYGSGSKVVIRDNKAFCTKP